MSKFYLMTGISGSGKTTLAKFLATQKNLRYINIDAFYHAVFGDIITHKHENEVWAMCFKAIELAIEDGVDVILDTNSPLLRNRTLIFNKFASHFNEKYLIWVHTTAEQCVKNNSQRARQIPDEEMQRMLFNYESPTSNELSMWDDIISVDNQKNSFTDMISIKKGENVVL